MLLNIFCVSHKKKTIRLSQRSIWIWHFKDMQTLNVQAIER